LAIRLGDRVLMIICPFCLSMATRILPFCPIQALQPPR